jgi:molecular chaperone GrpE
MFKQVLSTSSRALRSSTRIPTQTPVLRAQFAPAPLGVSPASIFRSQLARAPSGAAARISGARWYSDQAEPAAKEDKKEKESTQDAEAREAEEPADAVAELKAKLEAKDKEARQWKVRRAST